MEQPVSNRAISSSDSYVDMDEEEEEEEEDYIASPSTIKEIIVQLINSESTSLSSSEINELYLDLENELESLRLTQLNIDEFELDSLEISLKHLINILDKSTTMHSRYFSCLTQLLFTIHDLIKKKLNNDNSYKQHCFEVCFNIYLSHSMLNYLRGEELTTDKIAICQLLWETLTDLFCLPSTIKLPFQGNILSDYESVLKAFLIYIDRYSTRKEKLVHILLKLIGNLSDKTVCIPSFINCDYVPHVLKWFQNPAVSYQHRRIIISLIHNLCRHECGINEMNKHNAVQILKDFKLNNIDSSSKSFNKRFMTVYYMSLALLLEPIQIKTDIISIDQVVDHLLLIAENAFVSDDYYWDGFHISESLIVLVKLFVNDTVADYVLQRKQKLKFFKNCFLQFSSLDENFLKNDLNRLARVSIVNILWSISFHDEWKTKLQNDEEFLSILNNLIKHLSEEKDDLLLVQFERKYLSTVTQALKGIMFNLEDGSVREEENSIVQTTQPLPSAVAAPAPHHLSVMISYSHSDVDFVKTLVDALKPYESLFNVWIDYENCKSEDLWEEIALSIEQASVVLLIVTQSYFDSKSCRREVTYAIDRKQKRILPIYVGSEYVASGWLGIRIEGPQYVRFGKKSFEETIEQLTNMIVVETQPKTEPVHYETPERNSVHVESNIAEHVELAQKSIENTSVALWSADDIVQWARIENISLELIMLLNFRTGKVLMKYGKLVLKNENDEYIVVSQRFQQKYNKTLYREEFAQFLCAIENLIRNQQHQGNIQPLRPVSFTNCLLM
ncbi:unnamed protein product [Didymodactylos carnosus]|uniref:TIR domain-containing protein n=1 Tax=Didymodactylos carnosus TaxID=1234261 RepID=A0A814VC80_9BILA|nr:unnamed protein product [Didymodactylos carnosus]CAF1185354.1 unnamed protein product [Didymodactylos carnosus]CAF3764403.1 unnamed protein product [Didymodactylos carnosus]CAF3949633.1 unnamed protein product [Didymodactylos carnosus]